MEKGQFSDKIQDVAKILNLTMIMDDESREPRCELTDVESIRIIARNSSWPPNQKDHINFHGVFPTGKHGYSYQRYDQYFDIYVSGNKDAARIARDIQRRLLPEYLKVLKTVIKMKEEDDEKNKETIFAYKTIADHLNIKSNSINTSNEKSIWIEQPHVGHKIIVHNKDDIRFEVSLDAERTIKVLDFIKTLY